jgi:hypothetical protein
MLIFVCANLMGPWLFWDAYVWEFSVYCAIFATGGLVAEFCLLAIWCAWGAQSFVFRLPLTTTLVIVAACSFVLGLQIPEDGMPRGLAVFLMVSGLLLFGGVQVPMWIRRVVTQQEIDVPSETDDTRLTTPSAQFGVRHVLIGMALVGLLLVLVKYSLPPGSLDGPTRWFGIIAGGLTFIVFSATISLPCVLLTLGDHRRGLWALTLLLVTACGPLAVCLVLVVIENVNAYDLVETAFAIFAFGLGAAATHILVLLIARAMGYRLVTPGRLVVAQPVSPRDQRDVRDTTADN